MIVYPERRYEFRSEVTYKPCAIMVQCFHYIALIRDVDDEDAVYDEVEVPAAPMRLKQPDGSFIEIPRPGAKPTISRVLVKPGYEGVRINDPEAQPDIARQVAWDFKIRRGRAEDVSNEYVLLESYPKERKLVRVNFTWDSGSEPGDPVTKEEVDYDRWQRIIHNVHDGARIDHDPSFSRDTSLEDIQHAIRNREAGGNMIDLGGA